MSLRKNKLKLKCCKMENTSNTNKSSEAIDSDQPAQRDVSRPSFSDQYGNYTGRTKKIDGGEAHLKYSSGRD